VLERNEEAMQPEPLPGYVWLDTSGKVLHVQAARLEFGSSRRLDGPQLMRQLLRRTTDCV
jgi:hypothetical protein